MMKKAPVDRMVREGAGVTKEETEEEKKERERLEKLKKIWGARYRDLPRPPDRASPPPEEIAKREGAWETI